MTLIEVLIALALFSIIAIVFLSGLTVAARAVLIGDVRTTAESLARAQMEYVKSQDYIYHNVSDHDDYAEIDGYPAVYGITITVEPIDPAGEPYGKTGDTFDYDDGIQKITVAVSHDGKVVFTLEGYKVER